MSKKLYVISYFIESKNKVINEQRAFDTYDDAIDFGHSIVKACNIKFVCLEIYIVSYKNTSVLKD